VRAVCERGFLVHVKPLARRAVPSVLFQPSWWYNPVRQPRFGYLFSSRCAVRTATLRTKRSHSLSHKSLHASGPVRALRLRKVHSKVTESQNGTFCIAGQLSPRQRRLRRSSCAGMSERRKPRLKDLAEGLESCARCQVCPALRTVRITVRNRVAEIRTKRNLSGGQKALPETPAGRARSQSPSSTPPLPTCRFQSCRHASAKSSKTVTI
jgi:hypothetical protein